METRRLSMRLDPVRRSGDLVLRSTALSVGYADEGRPLFNVPDLTLLRAECAAIIGPNGAGKTTFLKTLLEQIPPYAGQVELGAGLKIGYFAQAHEGLHPDYDLIREIQSEAPQMLPGEAREYLAKFLFTGDDAFKLVSVLSGGERGRLALAKLSLSGANLLLLDEPSNHLDLTAQEVLQGVLSSYKGTILLVSHDRYLIDVLATQVWEVDPQQVLLRVYQGGYSDYKAAKEVEAESRSEQDAEVDLSKKPMEKRPRSHSLTSVERKRRASLEEMETKISALEGQVNMLSKRLEDPPDDPLEVQRLGSDYVRLQAELDKLMSAWENLSLES
jgi:ATP-binding cassette subfamily F protein 3